MHLECGGGYCGTFSKMLICRTGWGHNMLCKNPETMRQEHATRNSMITAVCKRLATKANVKNKRDKLAYYIQWHAMKKLNPLFEKDGIHENKRWTFKHVIERLKQIRSNVCLVKGIIIKHEITQPDKEQKEILDLLGVKLPEPVK